MANFATDSFSGEASNVDLNTHTSTEDSTTWTAESGQLNISSTTDSVYSVGSGTNLYTNSGTPASADYTVSCDMVSTATAQTLIGLAGRVADSSNYYWFRWNDLSGEWQLYETISGSTTLLDNTADTLSGSTTYAAVFSLSGSATVALDVQIDTVSKVSANDSSANRLTAAGKSGIRAFGADATFRVDNYSADDITAGGATGKANPFNGPFGGPMRGPFYA